MKKFVYLFKEADGKNKALFGGKGANLAEMTNLHNIMLMEEKLMMKF